MLRCFGSSGAVLVAFQFAWNGGQEYIKIFLPSRSAAARLLWRFRKARHAVRCLPRSVVRASCVPRFGLRWLALRNRLTLFVAENGIKKFKIKRA